MVSEQEGFVGPSTTLKLLFILVLLCLPWPVDAVTTRSGRSTSAGTKRRGQKEPQRTEVNNVPSRLNRWLNWTWSFFTRTKPPPIIEDIVVEEAKNKTECGNVFQCGFLVAKRSLLLLWILLKQTVHLCVSPVSCILQGEDLYLRMTLPFQDITVETVAFLLWFLATNVVCWFALKAFSLRFWKITVPWFMFWFPVMQMLYCLTIAVGYTVAEIQNRIRMHESHHPNTETQLLKEQLRENQRLMLQMKSVVEELSGKKRNVEHGDFRQLGTSFTGDQFTGQVSAITPRHVVCLNCQSRGHWTTECPKQRRCFICRSAQHLASQCPLAEMRRKQEDVASSSAAPVSNTVVKPSLRVPISMGESQVKMVALVDPGSSVNVIPLPLIVQHQFEVDVAAPEVQNMVIRSFNGVTSPVYGLCILRVIISTWKTEAVFVVIDSVETVILGMPILSDLKLNVNPAERALQDERGHSFVCALEEHKLPNCQLKLKASAKQKNNLS